MSSRAEREAARVTHEVAARAIRRLDILEWVILGGAMLMAIAGGALVSWLIAPALPASFRTTWIVASLGLFGVPGVITLVRLRRDERDARAGDHQRVDESDGRR